MMPAVALAPSAGHYADAVALYSQHLARPSSASHPPPGRGGRGQGRRRPRSAFATTSTAQGQPSPPSSAKEILASAGQRKAEQYRRRVDASSPVTRPTRPASASAAVFGGPKARPLPVRPSRRRPVTATGTSGSSYMDLRRQPSRRARGGRQSSRRAFSAGCHPRLSDSVGHRLQENDVGRANTTTAEGPAWGYEKTRAATHRPRGTDTQVIASAHAGLEFYHKHENLEADPEIMRRATEYVSKILHGAKKDGAQQEAKPSPQPHPPPNANNFIPRDATSRQTSAVKPHKVKKQSTCRPGRGWRRKHPQRVSAVETTTNVNGRHVAVRTRHQHAQKAPRKCNTASREEDRVGHSTPENDQGQEDRSDQLAANSRDIAGSCDFPFPSGVRDARKGTSPNGIPGKCRKVNNVGTERSKANEDDTITKDDPQKDDPCSSSSPITPLAFDFFRSLRPTIFRETGRAKQSRSGPNVPRGSGSGSGDLSGKECGNFNGKDISHHRCREQFSASQRVVGGPEERRAAGAWTSVFGAVCAGAERGRARAEALKAARQAVVQLKRKRRCVAAPAVPSVQPESESDEPASTMCMAVGRPGGELSSGEPAKGRVVGMVEDGKPQTIVGSGDTEKETRLDAGNSGVKDDNASCARLGEGVDGGTDQHSKEGTIERIKLNADAKDAEQSPDAEDIESYKLSTPSGRHRMPETASVDRRLQQPRNSVSTPPLFRYPFGGGPTCIAVNAPRSLQVCPGDRGYLLSSPQRRSTLQGYRLASSGRPWHRSLDRSPLRRPSTASDTACRGTVAIGNDAECERGIYVANAAGGLKQEERPETAWSFFSKGKPYRRRGGEQLNLFEKSRHQGTGKDTGRYRWTDGHSLRRRVDSIAKEFYSGNGNGNGTVHQCGGDPREEEEKEKNNKQDGFPGELKAGGAVSSFQPVESADGSTEKRPQSTVPDRENADHDTGENCDPAPALPAASIALAVEGNAFGAGFSDPSMASNSEKGQPSGSGPSSMVITSTRSEPAIERREQDVDTVGVGGDAHVIFFSQVSGDSPTSHQQSPDIAASLSAGNKEYSRPVELDGVGEAGDAPGRSLVDDTMSAPPPATDPSIGAMNSSLPGDHDGRIRKSRRLAPRPVSAPGRPSAESTCALSRRSPESSSTSSVSEIRRSVSSPGFMEGGHHPGRSLVVKDIAVESRVVLGRRQSCAVRGRAAASVSGIVAFGSGNAPPEASYGTGGPFAGDECDKEAAPREGGPGAKGGEEDGAGSTPKSKSRVEYVMKTDERTQDSSIALAENSQGESTSGKRLPRSGGGPKFVDVGGAAPKGIGYESKTRSTTKAVGGHSAGAEVESLSDFHNATVKLKFLAADASAAVDRNEKAWQVSKEQAEVMFNDLRSAAEEDAQRSGEGAASETRHRLQRIVIESGYENSRRVEKEAALEEGVRVLRQDTAMYEARASASDRMLQVMRTLEAENDSCDLSALLECRWNKSLTLLHDRTERDRDELRAACRRRREEAAVMDSTLAEARHARKLLLGHAQHTVERMVCLAEYVSIMRRWCQAQLTARKNARVTSRAINIEFEKKSKELDVLLMKGAPSTSSAVVSAGATVQREKYRAERSQAKNRQHLHDHRLFPNPNTRRAPASTTNDKYGDNARNIAKASNVAFSRMTPSGINNTIITTTIPHTTTPITDDIITNNIDTTATPHNEDRNAPTPAAGLDDSTPFETLRDASMQLRRLLLSLSTSLSAAEEFSDSFAPVGARRKG